MDLKIDVPSPDEAAEAAAPPSELPSVWRPIGVADWLLLALSAGAVLTGLVLAVPGVLAEPTPPTVAAAVAALGVALPLLRVALRALLRWLAQQAQQIGWAIGYLGDKIS